jgi:dephospho-CoA kinase
VAAPLAVAVTGGIGAGKSEALACFDRLGAATISSDEIVHRLLREDPDVKRLLGERWGETIFDEAGQVDRKRVSGIVFKDRAELEWLEGVLHPRVAAEYLAWRERVAELDDAPDFTVTEVPLLYEVGGETRFDAVVALNAPRKLREARGRIIPEERTDRLLGDKEKMERADFSYVNTGTVEELYAFCASVLEQLRARTRV